MEKQLRVLAEVLSVETDLLFPCVELPNEWCFKHCKDEGESYPNAECWLRYAEKVAKEAEQ